jgi:RNA polymerase sigma factor (sigma-70 family)
VSATLPLVDSPGDAELIAAVRGGDADAYGELFSRHVDAARRLGRQLVSGPDVDDLVAEAFAKVFAVLRRGGGPDLAFRAYLLTAVRRLHVDRIRAGSRLHTTDDLSPFDAGVPFRDTAVEGFENATAARAFASLPERWQLVLWHTEVEGQKPADVGLLLGMSANSVSALAYRAREGLRQAFLSMHVRETEGHACALTRERLGAYLRDGVSRRDRTRIEAHLQECRRCAAVYLELGEVNANLSGLLAPVLLGGAAAAYVASSGSATSVGLAALLDRARELALTHAPVTAAVGVGAGALVVGGLFLGLREPGPDPRPVPEATGSGDVRVAPHAQPDRLQRGNRPASSPSAHPGADSPAGPPRPAVRRAPAGAAPAGAAAAELAAPVTAPAPAPAPALTPPPAPASGTGSGTGSEPTAAEPSNAPQAPTKPSRPDGAEVPSRPSRPSQPVLEASVTARPTPETSVTVGARATASPPVRPDGPVRPHGVAVEKRVADSSARVTVTPGRDR